MTAAENAAYCMNRNGGGTDSTTAEFDTESDSLWAINRTSIPSALSHKKYNKNMLPPEKSTGSKKMSIICSI